MVKFGKQIKRLVDPAHLNHYVAYDVLKKAINVVVQTNKPVEGAADVQEDIKHVDQAFGQIVGSLSGPSARPPDSRFHGLLQHELAKVNRFFSLQLRSLLDTLRDAQRVIVNPQPLSEEDLSEAERLLDKASEELVGLEHFRRLNFTGFRKIVKKFDKSTAQAGVTEGALSAWFIPQLLREFFVAAPLDTHLLALSLGYAAVRRHRRGTAKPLERTTSVLVQEASSMPSSTTTFWLTPAARIRALCTLVKRFEITVPAGGLGMDMSGASGSAASVSEQMRRVLLSMAPDGPARVPCRLTAETSMVYYDGPGFPEYVRRVRRTDGEPPCGFRSRQTTSGRRAGGASELIERDGCASALSMNAFTPVSIVKATDAFPMVQSADAADALKASAERVMASAGESDELSALSKESLAQVKSFAREVAEAAEKASPLSACAAVGCARVILQGDTSATLGISIALDEDVQLSREPAGPAATAPADAIDFPYCLLEITNEGNEASPSGQWIEELRGLAALRNVAGFSIGTHAVACVHKDEVPEFPHWYQHLHSVESIAPPEAWGLMLEWRQAVADTDQAGEATTTKAAESLRGTSGPLPTPPPKPEAKEKVKDNVPTVPLEPKNYMASERTMLEWMHTVLALAFLGIGLWRLSLDMGEEPTPTCFGLLNGDSTSSLMLGVYGLVLVAIAIAFAWYAFLSHIGRLNALMSGGKLTEGVFNRRTGPVIFSLAVGVALLGHMAVQVIPLWLSLDSSDGGVTVAVATEAANAGIRATS